jgi:serine protease Do
MKKNLMLSGIIALVVSLATIGVFTLVTRDAKTVKIEHITGTPSKSALFTLDENNEVVPLDFTGTAEKVIDGVVHIKSTQVYAKSGKQPFRQRDYSNPFRDFFGDEFEQFFGPFQFQDPGQRPNGPQTRVGSGSGVIISTDGYIVTNNHVIANADDIEVTLHDNRTYKATIIGTDPTTDLALIQIKEKGLTSIPFTNSDEVKVGEWVLAVGNPFSLNSTITAGIVSAKGRNINILREQYAVEDFIQTDAAINPGNSGGALVNLEGALVGINTAIASPTGTYSGYGFAVPTNIVQKVVEDLINFGTVQRGCFRYYDPYRRW